MHERSPNADRRVPDLSLLDIAAFFSRQWRFILAVTGVAVVFTAGLVFVVLPRQYEAAATLVVVSPRFTNEPRPATLALQGYQQLLESDAAIRETTRRLRAEGVLQADDKLRLGKELVTRFLVPQRSKETMVAPMLLPVAKWSAAEAAEQIANTWAEVLLEQIAFLRKSSTEPLREVVRLLEAKSERLSRLEDERLEAANAYRQERNAMVDTWERRFLAHRQETSDLLSAYSAETARLIESLRREAGFEASELRLETVRKAYSELQVELASVNSRLQLKQLELKGLDEQLEVNPPKLELRRSIPEEALWRTLAESRRNAWKRSLLELEMVTEVLNPVHTDMAHRRSEAAAEVAALLPRSRQLVKELATLEQRVKAQAARVGANIAGLEELKQLRSAGHLKLREERSAGGAGLERQKERELSAADTGWETRREQLDRRIGVERDLLTGLTQQHKEAILASTGMNVEDVRLASPAVAPEIPLARNGAQKLLLAACLGSVLALLIALFRDNLSADRSPAAPPGRGATSGVQTA